MLEIEEKANLYRLFMPLFLFQPDATRLHILEAQVRQLQQNLTEYSNEISRLRNLHSQALREKDQLALVKDNLQRDNKVRLSLRVGHSFTYDLFEFLLLESSCIFNCKCFFYQK